MLNNIFAQIWKSYMGLPNVSVKIAWLPFAAEVYF